MFSFSDVREDTLALLNVTFQPECDFETLLSSLSNNAESFLPPRSWLDAPGEQPSATNTATGPALLSNGRRVPEQREFYLRVRELFVNNADAFSTLTRKSSGSQAPLRLAHFRKFWEGLDNLAYYWDTSLDEYLPPAQEAHGDEQTDSVPLSDSTDAQVLPETGPDRASTETPTSRAPGDEEPRKKAKTEDTGRSAHIQSDNSNRKGVLTTEYTPTAPNRALPARAAPPKTPWAANMEPQGRPVDLSKGSYRGYRIGNGAEMPDQYRIECVRSFLEPIVWAFGVTLSPHRRPPVLTIEHVRFPVRMSSVAWRGPQDRTKARQGFMEGPVLGMQCRADVNFGATGKLNTQSTLDAVRELGGLLLLAQERAREGKSERRGGEGKWWTTKDRWGGGPGGEVGEATGATEVLAKDAAFKPEEKPVERNRDGSKARRRPTPAEVWKTLRPGNPLWDPKVSYEAIGKDKNVEWDNTPSDPDWCSPKLQRTRWFDLFSIEDRTEAMRGIWGIMSYLMRAESESSENAAMNE
ncbi:hypothetical protein DDE82_000237 [Stemphylium lycopersici]|uniref:Uncharacterized protein n=1 Tax=Stemphylium lycopersici TaxID=183478 RepID=A0A364MYU6_STELY|nr:hypothetical protein TW65_08665 [Stemphylium lycopersici]RAR07585.1 hypothetical protein DDE83_006451 [Stemphylium lycopersici]RAR11899.1 hypothetical protein DDE82_000237 [Stemphylium lycopersici]